MEILRWCQIPHNDSVADNIQENYTGNIQENDTDNMNEMNPTIDFNSLCLRHLRDMRELEEISITNQLIKIRSDQQNRYLASLNKTDQ